MPTPLTVEFIGTRIDAADAIALYTATKIAGGGASPGEQLASLFKQGTAAVATTYPSASRFVTLTNDRGVGRDFTGGGAFSGQLIWVWGNALLALTSTGTNTSNAIGGMGIIVGSDVTIGGSYAGWTFYGSENYPGGFQKMVVDPTLRPTFSGGTWVPGDAGDISAIRHIGIFFISDSAAKGGADAAIIDAIDIGSGLRIYGSGTEEDGFGDLIAADEGDIDNQYGVIKSLEATETILQLQGYLEIGSGDSTFTRFNDINKVIAFNNPQYIDTTSVTQFANSLGDEFQRINIVGNTTSGTEVEFGIKVGDGDTARGRNGITFLGNADYRIALEVEDEPNINVKMYGTSIRDFDGAITWPAESGHEFIGSTVDGSAQFDGDSGIEIRNSTFQNATGYEGSFVWNSGTDIKNSNFVANANVDGSGAGIEHPFSGTFIYDNLQFGQNDFDINFSLSTSGDLLVQATEGANPATATSGNVNSTVNIENTVVLTLTDIVTGSEVRIFQTNTANELAGIESEDDGTFLYAYNYTGDFNVDLVVLSLDYKYFRSEQNELTSNARTIRINQVFDRNYDNP